VPAPKYASSARRAAGPEQARRPPIDQGPGRSVVPARPEAERAEQELAKRQAVLHPEGEDRRDHQGNAPRRPRRGTATFAQARATETLPAARAGRAGRPGWRRSPGRRATRRAARGGGKPWTVRRRAGAGDRDEQRPPPAAPAGAGSGCAAAARAPASILRPGRRCSYPSSGTAMSASAASSQRRATGAGEPRPLRQPHHLHQRRGEGPRDQTASKSASTRSTTQRTRFAHHVRRRVRTHRESAQRPSGRRSSGPGHRSATRVTRSGKFHCTQTILRPGARIRRATIRSASSKRKPRRAEGRESPLAALGRAETAARTAALNAEQDQQRRPVKSRSLGAPDAQDASAAGR